MYFPKRKNSYYLTCSRLCNVVLFIYTGFVVISTDFCGEVLVVSVIVFDSQDTDLVPTFYTQRYRIRYHMENPMKQISEVVKPRIEGVDFFSYY